MLDKLYGAASGNTEYKDDEAISKDKIATQQLRQRLSQFWLLKTDTEDWDEKAKQALLIFKTFRSITETGLGKITAAELINTSPESLIRGYSLDGSFASRILIYVVLKHFRISNNPQECNIIYFRGMNHDGTANDNKPFVFNDRCVILKFKKEKAFIPYIEYNWLASCDPGEYYWINPMNPKGCGDIKTGQYKAWKTGYHKDQYALIQSGDITLLRGEKRIPDTGDDFYVDQHSVGIEQDYSFGDEIGKWSAACMVLASRSEHDNERMPVIDSDPRQKASPGEYEHWTSIIDATEFLNLFPIL